MSGITDRLVEAAGSGQTIAYLEDIRTTHRDTARALGVLNMVEDELDELLENLGVALDTPGLEKTGPERDRVLGFGERLAAPIVAAAVNLGEESAVSLDATEFLLTDSQWGDAWSLGEETERRVSETLTPLLAQGLVPIVTGYCGRGPDGRPTTMGRGGSDSSATLLAAALNAKRVTLWSDVPWCHDSGPKIGSIRPSHSPFSLQRSC